MIRKAALQIGVPALLVFIAWNAYLAVNHLQRVRKTAALTLESSAIQAKLSGVLKDLTDMETGQRGYLLTGDPAYLQPYTDAKGRIEMDFVDLRAGLSNRTQRERSLESQLESLAESKQTEMEHSISLRQQGYRLRSFKLVDTNEGKDCMDEIRRIVSSLSSAESSTFCNHDFQFCPAFACSVSVWTDPIPHENP
jgi:CHASE3 domain sensor protein